MLVFKGPCSQRAGSIKFDLNKVLLQGVYLTGICEKKQLNKYLSDEIYGTVWEILQGL